jgi:hypothetical protein
MIATLSGIDDEHIASMCRGPDPHARGQRDRTSRELR